MNLPSFFLAGAMLLASPLMHSVRAAQPEGAAAAPVQGPALSGAFITGHWGALGREVLPQYTSDAKPWEEGLANQTGEAKLTLRKVSGSGFAVRSGLYCGGGVYKGPLQEQLMSGKVLPDDIGKLDRKDFSGLGVWEVDVAQAQAGVKNVVLTLRIIGLPQNEHFTPFQLIERAFPASLFLNGAKEPIHAVGRLKVSKGLTDGFPEEIYALQWDLSEVKEPIRSLRVEWTMYPHSSLTGLRLDQSDTFTPIKPEPSPSESTAKAL